MRVTNLMISDALKSHIQNNLAKLSRTQEQLSTGKTILRPSDNPTDISTLMALKAQKEINKQYTKNIDDGLAYLYAADNALGLVGDMLAQANTYAVQAANGTLEETDMAAIGEQIDKMIDEMIDIANTMAGGKYIFAGKENNQPPFYRDPVNPDIIKYRGDLERISREIANQSEHYVDAPGVTNDPNNMGIFGYVDTATSVVDGGLFAKLIELRDELNSGNQQGVGDLIGDIQDQLDHVLQYRVAVGARTRHFEAAKKQMLDREIIISQSMESIESADISRLSIDLSEQQMVYQASLAAGANIMQVSLLNFLK